MFKKILKFLGRKSPVDLDNDGKIESLQEEIVGLFSKFAHMHNKLNEVNGELHKIKTEEEFVVAKAKERIAKIEQEVETNSNLAEKVAEFIK